MLEFNSANILSAIGYISAVAASFREKREILQRGDNHQVVLDQETKAWLLLSIQRIAETSESLEMHASSSACRRAHEGNLKVLSSSQALSSRELEYVIRLLEQVVQVFADEMRAQLVFSLPGKHASFFAKETPFGREVDDAFPTATFDISEASKCRAVGRWTACVMHLMRVLETGLSALSKHYGVETGSNWNQVLNQIEAKTREVSRSSHGAEAEQWASEAATHLRFVKNAWRNHAMHHRQTYDEERAVAIFDSSRSFMRHLAEKLSEVDFLD